ncbi:MAG: PadR family transcriptional regulator [Candidatus Angelobacter sp.]|nr:PadR family transcriptional regulator [Candidatus Angelobacter sp.]
MKRRKTRSTPFAILGMLTIAPMSGYDMKQVIEQSIAHFWSESYGQIYPTLKRLATAGQVTRKVERNSGKPDRQVYAINAKGREALTKWLSIPAQTEPVRNEFLLKLFFGAHLPSEEITERLQEFRTRHAQSVATYKATEAQLRREHANNPNLPYWMMTLNFGRHRSQAIVDWADETTRTLQKMKSPRAAAVGNKKR